VTLSKPVEEGPDMVSTLIVDDHAWMREALRQMVDSRPTLRVCGDADSAAHAVDVVHEQHPDLALIDVTLGVGAEDGIALTRRLVAENFALRVLVISLHESAEFASRSLRAGAMGFVNKQVDVAEMIAAVERVADDRLYIDAPTLAKLCGTYRASAEGESCAQRIDQLSREDRQMLELIGADLGSHEIGRRLHLDHDRVHRSRSRLAQALGVDAAYQLHCLAHSAAT